MYANVIVEYGVKKLDKTFTYKIPEYLIGKVCVGMKVSVPFGSQVLVGFVTELKEKIEPLEFEIKEILDIVDNELILSPELMDLGLYLKESTMCTLISAYQTMLPSSLKIKSNTHNYDLYEVFVVIKDIDKAKEYINLHPRRLTHINLINTLLERGEVLKTEFKSGVVNALVKEDIIKLKKYQKYRINEESKSSVKVLTPLQQKVFDSVKLSEYNTYLLYGVTGSGKTEVYIKLVESVINSGFRALVLVPEITLTTQIARRFYDVFGSDVAILHSSLSQGERYDEYLKIYRSDVSVVVGTRSAVFAPISNLGIIIMDEEDSSSYKQENNPRYHARDIAIYRAKYNNIPLLLGSATPSLESKARADKGVYKLLTLKSRVGASMLPKIHIVDMSPEMRQGNTVFSDLLKTKIEEKLMRHEQIILLLNRRGFSTFITCSNCGFVYKCPNCDITLTYHKTSNTLVCHYCGYKIVKNNLCPNCREDSINYYGLGTEKLEEKIKEMYPESRVVRMDQDTTSKKGTHEKIITDFKDYKYDILLGTQMISKGLDFPKVTLVGVINADASLNIPDYKSAENTFSLLYQVAGRSGRADVLGEVVIQTFNPDNYVIKCVSENNYDKFYVQEMNFRHNLNYPPYYYLVSLKVIGKIYEDTIKCSNNVKKYLDTHLNKEIITLGPTMAQVFKFNNEFRMQIIIKYKKLYNLKDVLKEIENLIDLEKDIRLEIDFNPIKI